MYISIKELKTENDFVFAVEQFKLLAKIQLKAEKINVKSLKNKKDYLAILVYPKFIGGEYSARMVPKHVDIVCLSEKQLNKLERAEILHPYYKNKLENRLSFMRKVLWKNKVTLKKLKSDYTNYLYKEQIKVLKLANELNKLIIEHQMYCYEGPYIEMENKDEKLKYTA